MNEERVKKNVELIEGHLQAIMEECPELNDAVLCLNWKRSEVSNGDSIPASMAVSNRKNSNEVHIQAVELARILADSALTMHERVIEALLEVNSQMGEQLDKQDENTAKN